jgi:predicted DCC family thiol-disulfide oxidoreductase YuxK
VLQVAALLGDADRAAALVEPFAIERLTPATAKRWLDLLSRYGLAWCWQVIERWASNDHRRGDPAARASWLASLSALGAPLCADGGDDGVELVRRMARAQWAWLDARIDTLLGALPSNHATKAIEALGRPIVGLLAAAALAGDETLRAAMIERLTTERRYPIAGLVAVLRAGAVAGRVTTEHSLLRDHCVRVLNDLVSTPSRAPGDWSMAITLRCTCELCGRLTRFLRAADQRLEWPLAKDRRAHVHQTATSHELPLTHVTRRVGSPHTLVLTKTKALFSRDAAERASWQRDLAWLEETISSGKVGSSPSSRRRTR